ncbi:MAG: TonB-dependent receptor [Bryobacterales bacterium]|nr:TonB-dependent receptor [Bryobacterales bacterium]
MILRLTLLLAILSTAAWPQSLTSAGAIQGTVVDSTGGVLPEVRVRLTSVSGAGERSVASDDTGTFRFPALGVGEYKLRLEKPGFDTLVVGSVAISVGQVLALRFELRPAQVVERLEVREQVEALEAAATTSSVALGSERIEEAPAQNRNYLTFVLLAPGVTVSAGSNTQRSAAGQRNATADSGFSFAGMRGRNNSLSIDGVDNRDETTGGNRVAIGLEMIQEFRISGVSVGAEFGGAAGGAVNVVTRSGANVWHGDATFFTQNEKLNARNPEALIDRRPLFRRYQPGASLMGPARRDRTFFATAVEQESESGEEWSDVPPEAYAAVARALAGRPAPELTHGLFPSGSGETEFSFKLNHQVGSKHSLVARYAFSRGRISNEVQDLDNFADRSARGTSLTRDHSLVAGWTFVVGPRLVHDVRGQLSRRSIDLTPNWRGPMYEVPGVLTFGQAYRLDASRTEDHTEFVDSLTVIAGRHQLNAGASLHSVRLDARLANKFAGVWVFPTLEDLVSGRPDLFIRAYGEPRTRQTTLPLGFWIQDRWQAAPGLTVEAGLRYDRQWMPSGIPAASRNLAPRLGLAWRPAHDAPWVFRAGFGLFFDRYALAFLNDAIQKDGRAGWETYLAGDATSAARSTYHASADFPATYSRKLSAGFERALDRDTTITAEFSSVAGFHLSRIRNAALTLPPQYLLEQTASSRYLGGTISLHRRLRKNLTYLVAYSAGRTHDDASDFDEHPMDPSNLRLDWARSRQHQSQRLAASALFDLTDRGPKPWAGITMAPQFTAGSGRPLNALETSDIYRTGAWPVSARPAGMSRNPFDSPPTVSLDVRVMKTILVKEGRAWLQTGLECFNLLNHSNALRVSPYYAARGVRLTSYREPIETLNARQIQFMIQFEY